MTVKTIDCTYMDPVDFALPIARREGGIRWILNRWCTDPEIQEVKFVNADQATHAARRIIRELVYRHSIRDVPIGYWIKVTVEPAGEER